MYQNMWDVVRDLEKNNMLIRIKTSVDPDLEMAEIHRQIYDKQGPAILFEKVKGSPFPALSNLYGTIDRTDFLFRKTIPKIKKVIQLKADPSVFLKNPLKFLSAPLTALLALPMRSYFGSPSMYARTTIDQLPMIKSWPMDGVHLSLYHKYLLCLQGVKTQWNRISVCIEFNYLATSIYKTKK